MILMSARVKLLVEFKDGSSERDMCAEIQAALNCACANLEQAPDRDPNGSVSYEVRRLDRL